MHYLLSFDVLSCIYREWLMRYDAFALQFMLANIPFHNLVSPSYEHEVFPLFRDAPDELLIVLRSLPVLTTQPYRAFVAQPKHWLDWLESKQQTRWHWFEVARIPPSHFTTDFYRHFTLFPWLSTRIHDMTLELYEGYLTPRRYHLTPIPCVRRLDVYCSDHQNISVLFPRTVWPSVTRFKWHMDVGCIRILHLDTFPQLRRLSLTCGNAVVHHWETMNLTSISICQAQVIGMTVPLPSLIRVSVQYSPSFVEFVCTKQAPYIQVLHVGDSDMPAQCDVFPNLTYFSVITEKPRWYEWLTRMPSVVEIELFGEKYHPPPPDFVWPPTLKRIDSTFPTNFKPS